VLNFYAVHFTKQLPPSMADELSRAVSPERRQRIKRFYHWQDAQRCLLAELLARYSIEETFNIPRNSMAFAKTQKDKPFVVNHPEANFNLSHSGEWIVCALSDTTVGVDVEKRQYIIPEVLALCYSKSECRILESLPESEQLDFFYSLWTIKESYVKAIGCGMELKFDEASVTLPLFGPIQMEKKGKLDSSAHFWTGSMDANHSAAICIIDDEPRQVSPTVRSMEMEDFLLQI